MRAKISSLALVLAVAVAPLLVTAPAEAAKPSISISKTSAVPGQYLVVRGKLPSRKAVKLTLVRTLYNGTVQTKYSKPDGSYSFRFRMASMPREGYKVRLPSGVSSKTVYVNAVRQEVTLTGSASSLTAAVVPRMARPMSLQKRTSATGWTTVARKTSGTNGVARFSAPAGPTYRVVAATKGDITSTYSLPLVTALPQLSEKRSALNEPSKIYNPQLDSNTSAAAKFGWWPAAITWDWEYGLGMNEWTNYSEGTGRSSLTYGGMWQYSGGFGDRTVNYGSLSTTYKKAGFGQGNWEFKGRTVQRGNGYTPYTFRYSLVPEGTPDGVEPRQEIIVAEYAGYGTSHRLGVRDGSSEFSKTVGGWAHNGTNWHLYGVQVTDEKVTWIVNRKIVASWKRTPGFKGQLVPRMELIAKKGERMTMTNISTDWIRYFALKSGAQLSGPTAGFTQTALSPVARSQAVEAPKKVEPKPKASSAPKPLGMGESTRVGLRVGR